MIKSASLTVYGAMFTVFLMQDLQTANVCLAVPGVSLSTGVKLFHLSPSVSGVKVTLHKRQTSSAVAGTCLKPVVPITLSMYSWCSKQGLHMETMLAPLGVRVRIGRPSQFIIDLLQRTHVAPRRHCMAISVLNSSWVLQVYRLIPHRQTQ